MTAVYEDLPVVATVAEVAIILGCSQRHVRSLISEGVLGHCKLGRLVKIPRHEILRLLGANGSAAPAGDATTNPAPAKEEVGRGQT